MSQQDQQLEAEYFHLTNLIDSFDQKSLTIKAWSVTLAGILAGSGAFFDRPGMLWVGVFGSLMFWLVEGHWKALTHLLNLRDQDLGTEKTQELAQVIQQHLQGLLRNLHSHHGFEDSSVFPAFKLQHPRLSAAIELMEQDHHALDQLLEVLHLRSQQSVQALRLRSEVESARLEADHLEQMLHGHMQNEEEILVPVYLTYG